MTNDLNIKLRDLRESYYTLPKNIRKKIWKMSWSKYLTPIIINVLLYTFSIIMGVYISPYDATIAFCLFLGTLYVFNIIAKAINYELYRASLKYINFIQNIKIRGIKENRKITTLNNIVVYSDNFQKQAER